MLIYCFEPTVMNRQILMCAIGDLYESIQDLKEVEHNKRYTLFFS
jgi:hypothetical protein